MGVIACNVFPGSLVDALWGARAKWQLLGHVLGLPDETLQVIEGRAVS